MKNVQLQIKGEQLLLAGVGFFIVVMGKKASPERLVLHWEGHLKKRGRGRRPSFCRNNPTSRFQEKLSPALQNPDLFFLKMHNCLNVHL